MIRIAAERLRSVVAEVFQGAGAPPDTAAQVAESLVENNLTGHDSHGVLRVGYYVDAIQAGRLNPRGEVTTVRQSATTALLDGGSNFGQVVARAAMQLAMQRASEHDLCMVAIRNCGHTGRLGEYAVQAAQAGYMGLVLCTGAGGPGMVAPYLGASRLLHTNPLAWAVPALVHPPVFLDYATSMVAQGKIQAAVDKGVSIPNDWLLDADGHPTTNPTEQYRGGMLLPFGRHKGYCLSLLVELVAGGFTGAELGPLSAQPPGCPTVLLAVNIAAFQPLDEFRGFVEQMIATTKAGRKAPGVEEILVPGEPEWRSRELRLRAGIEVPDPAWQRIVAAGAKCGVTVAA